MLFEAHNKSRALKIALQLKDFIKKGDRILDIGLGNGYVGKQIKEHYKIYMEGVDVVDYNETNIKNTIYDGLNLPFKDKSFDSTLILQTLHHCTDQIRVIKEAKRVSRKKIIIMEDIYNNFFEKMTTFLHDYISNKRKGINCPYDFHNKAEWQAIFKKLGLKIVKEKGTMSKFWFVKFNHVTYVLDVK